MVDTSNEGEPQKGAETVGDGIAMPESTPDAKNVPRDMPQREIITNQLELPDNDHTSENVRMGVFVYPNSRVLHLGDTEAGSTPQVELRFWKREDQKLVPWEGDVYYVVAKSPRVRSISGYRWYYEHGRFENERVPMDAVRFGALPADFTQDENDPLRRERFFLLGQEYIIDCRGEYGVPIGRGQIKVPDTLEMNQVVVFNVIANEYDPPLPVVYTFKGKIEGYEHRPGSWYDAILSKNNYYSGTLVNEKGEFSLSSKDPFPGGVTVYIRSRDVEEPCMRFQSPLPATMWSFPGTRSIWLRIET